MSSMHAANASFISLKLSMLEKQRDNLQAFCNDVNKVLSDGQAWVDGTDENHLSFEEMSRKLEEMLFLLCSKGLVATDIRESPKQMLQQQGSISGEASTSQDQQEISTVTENVTRVELLVPGYVKQILSRLDVMDIAVASLKTSTEKISETQTEVQTQVENVKQNQSQMEEQQTRQLADIEKKVKKMDKHFEGIKQQERRVIILEKELEAVKQREDRVTSLESEIQTLKRQEKKINSLEKEMETLSQKSEKTATDLESKTFSNKKQEKRVSSLENKVEAMDTQLQELEEKTFRKIDKVEKQAEVNTDVTCQFKSRIESLTTKVESTDTAVQDLSNRMNEGKTQIDELSTCKDENCRKIETLEKKTRNIVKLVNKNKKTGEEKLLEVKTEYKMVCHIVANRLLPLERLRTILNQKIKTRDQNVKTLGEVVDKVTDLEQKTADLEQRVSSRSRSTPVGFTATYPDGGFNVVPKKGNIFTNFTNVIYNFGNGFDPLTGIFTAPISGVYGVFCSLDKEVGGKIDVNATRRSAAMGFSHFVCGVCNDTDETNSCGFGIVQMSVGDTLYVKVINKEGNVKVGYFSSFSCFLIG